MSAFGAVKRLGEFVVARAAVSPSCGDIDCVLAPLVEDQCPNPSALKPTAHFAVETRVAPWHVEDGLPGERLDANERINQRWRAAYGDDAAPGLDTARNR